jgi:uncharacterized membrane protein
MNKWMELLIGLILVVVPIWVWGASLQWGAFWNFGSAAWTVLKGGLIWGILLIGLLFIMLGISDLKE